MDLILTTAVTLFIVIDPFGNLAVFHSILSSRPEKDHPRILIREMDTIQMLLDDIAARQRFQ